MNYRMICSILGHVVMLQSVLMLPSCLVGFLYGERQNALIYLVVAIFCLLLGLILVVYQSDPQDPTLIILLILLLVK